MRTFLISLPKLLWGALSAEGDIAQRSHGPFSQSVDLTNLWKSKPAKTKAAATSRLFSSKPVNWISSGRCPVWPLVPEETGIEENESQQAFYLWEQQLSSLQATPHLINEEMCPASTDLDAGHDGLPSSGSFSDHCNSLEKCTSMAKPQIWFFLFPCQELFLFCSSPIVHQAIHPEIAWAPCSFPMCSSASSRQGPTHGHSVTS